MQISITTNFPEVQRKLDSMAEGIRSKALVSALNKTVDQAKTLMGREITSEYSVTAAYVRERLRVKRASYRAGQLELNAELDGSNKRRSANLIRFTEKFVSLAQARKRAKAGTLDQLRFKIRKAGGAKIIKGAFIGNGGRTVFIRTTDKRLPIKALSTIDVPSMFNQRKINARVVGMIKDKFPVIFERDAAYFIAKFNQA